MKYGIVEHRTIQRHKRTPLRFLYLGKQGRFLSIEKPTLGVGFKRAKGYEEERKTPFAIIRSAVCQLHNEKQKEVIRRWRMTRTV